MKRKTVLALLATMALTTGATATTFAANYSDVKTGTPVSTYVTDVTDKGIMEGETDTEFGVAEGTTRSDLVQALYKLNINLPVTGSHEFTDIAGREDAAAIEWADDVGLFDTLNSNFFTDNKFEPDKDLTREEAAQILYTFAQKVDKMDVSKGVGSLDGYTDSAEATTYADALKWAFGNKIFTGDDLNTDEVENAVRATATISKAETAQALSVYMSLRGNTKEEVQQVVNTVAPKREVTTSTTSKENTATNTVTGNQDAAAPETPDQEEVTTPETPDTGDETVTEPENPDQGNQGGEVTEPENPDGEVTEPTNPENPDGGETTKPENPDGEVTEPTNPENPDGEETTEPENPDGGDVTEPTDPENPDGGETTDPEEPTEPENPDQGETTDPSEPTDPENPDGGETTDPEEPEQHTHTWGDPYYVIDQEAKYEKVEVIDQEEKWDWVTNIITPAWDEEITEIHTVCFVCGLDFDAEGMSNEALLAHMKDHALAGEGSGYGSKEVVVDTIHHEAVTEDVWTKVQDKISHFEDKLISPEKGHWEHTCADCNTTENCQKPEA